MTRLDPIKTTEAVVNRYLDYLTTTFSFNNVDLKEQFKRELKEFEGFVKGPILEATPPFETGKSILNLIEEGILSYEFQKLSTSELPIDRNLYVHQEIAIRKLIENKRNLIVATGTGSGKTETFLVPILNHLFRQKEKGELGPGVRALLLYPMNALANDQLKRLRRLLKNYPDVTFGSYTGETEFEERRAVERFKKMNPNEELLPNEILSREKMHESPPHILLTNYAMLEYLLLRPEDNVFFDGEYAAQWKFIVIDEIHIYTGAKGIELAMLLKRLKDRVVKSQRGVLQCIGTSATLVENREKDFQEVTEFAERLFDEKFEWIEDDFTRQDVVTGKKKSLVVSKESWGKPKGLLYLKWADIIDGEEKEKISLLVKEGGKLGVPEEIMEEALNNCDGEWRKFLYLVLRKDERLITLQNMLEREPCYLAKVSKELFEEKEDKEQCLAALVYLANNAKMGISDQPLLPARYHLFIRALEGGFISLLPQKRVFLKRREWVADEKGEEYQVFEIATCSRCNAIYLVGEIKERNGIKFLRQPGNCFYEDDNNLVYFLLSEDREIVPDNEDELVLAGKEMSSKVEEYVLCGKCGAIKAANEIREFCECGEKYKIRVIKSPSKNGILHKCPACGTINTTGSVARRFILGHEAATSVLATALYQQIPDRKEEKENLEIEDSEWSTNSSDESFLVTSNRRMLIFSDSRQDAAFFSTYLQTSYNQILQRRLIIMALEKYKEKVIKNEWRVEDLVEFLKRMMKELNIFPDLSFQQLEEEAWKWVLYEFLGRGGDTSLEALGLLGFEPVLPENWRPPKALVSSYWNFSEEEAVKVIMILLDSMRRNGAICFPDSINPQDEFFKPLNREFYFKRDSKETGKVYSWVPASAGKNNSRLDFLMRLAVAKGKKMDQEEVKDFLVNIWDRLLISDKSPWRKYFSGSPQEGYRLNLGYWRLVPSVIDKSVKWYRCTKCNKLWLHNVEGVCPTYRCDGQLMECNPEEELKDHHYKKLYFDILPLTLKTSEHTAQLTTESAAEVQKRFYDGEINILSCSTTFELGVDVGDLEIVFMRNVPPTPANYVQRAGRAGRKTSSTAFVLTFAQRRSHDFSHFINPLGIVNGKIQTPHLEITNEKIIKRHVYAVALALFWRHNPEYFGEVRNFFRKGEESAATLIKDFLNKRPTELKDSLIRIVPESMHEEIGIEDWSWVEGLLGEDGVLRKAERHLMNDIEELEAIEEEYSKRKKYEQASNVRRVINTLERRYIIDFLSQNNVIPKYGFPVDVVELKINHHGDEAKGLELTRDLKVALSEYAPESQVIAGGKLWTSKYIKKLPDREPIKYNYAICDYCGCYYSDIANKEKEFDVCIFCGNKIGRNRGTFITPEFGFVAGPPQKPTLIKPQRTYTTRKYFAQEEKIEKKLEFDLNGINVEIEAGNGRLVVINSAGKKGFIVCESCGYAEIYNGKPLSSHKTEFGKECKGKGISYRYSLGYEFKTDIFSLKFIGYHDSRKGFWESLLYGLIEGACRALEIERRDIDGTLYSYNGDPTSPAIVLFDDVPGGAGQVKRIAKEENFKKVLKETLDLVSSCECGGEEGDSSCYSCLRNYTNQYCHDVLKRRYVIEFVFELLK
ncbi:Protein of unknown function DUF1998 [Thermoanaerobacterium thermosaccharolyticum DSM 571]|uniref:DEAD/DEAH box helicase n=1 Tax=Thermoanaerobacterium thermosaccharolyticum (strain ATCC 7956 / DSM 571 / NCIMB 9385 / NCA 3814 / NCTC 13789 / WDCM 00135 / 2032) TaxID=580327 RepID=D9TMI0_THETC|nr:DEAD/DEAH box helicase [Thermoanaerobacterium thermosaccharolyticum]ADL68468.1 Protein of unknown function DUF1998 [Thermoanaerobacterium thermosaccharolyticum DSM 571]MCP2239468.1 ATP-dependent helicase YprA (DUF1998 family)/phage FluMu protein Com/DNA-directed RNA polymerase subunit M/transcription elongation factor TFIIS [Thermoanaerobacterium thermosaccharolyticum]